MKDLTKDEAAAEKKRKLDLADDMKRKDDVELKLFAAQIGVVDADKITERKDIEAAIDLKAEEDAAAVRQKLRDMEDEEGRKVAGEDDNRPKKARVLRSLNAEFCKDIPQEGRHGSFSPEDGDLRFGGDYDVPDGKYRVTGSEWVFTLADKKLVSADRASEQNKFGGKNVIAID